MSNLIISPYGIVTLSSATYGTILWVLSRRDRSQQSLRILIKAISAGHSTIATCLTVVSLCQSWHIDPSLDPPEILSQGHNYGRLDDSANPLISGRNALANFVTAWEAGYLIYDTGALFLESYVKDSSRGTRRAFRRLLRTSPIFVVHHVLLSAALLWLQTYIAVGREKGLKIIMAFALMNASSPVLHLRWWRRKTTGRNNASIDIALALVFAVTRFGSVYWVMEKYGQYHDLSPWQAFRMQRLPCQAGTGSLTAVNALWWLGLLRQMTKGKDRGA